jgi:hypothetical protein
MNRGFTVWFLLAIFYPREKDRAVEPGWQIGAQLARAARRSSPRAAPGEAIKGELTRALHDLALYNRDCRVMGEIGHPLLRRLYDYWSAKRGGRKLPRRRDIDPVELPAKLLPHLLLQDVYFETDRVRFRYRLVGQHFQDQIGRYVTWTYSDVALAPLGTYARYVIELFADSVRAETPSYSENIYIPTGQRAATLTKRLILPLSSDGRTVDKVLSGHVFEYPGAGIVQFGAGVQEFKEISQFMLPCESVGAE